MRTTGRPADSVVPDSPAPGTAILPPVRDFRANRLLAGLEPAVQTLLAPELQRVTLRPRQLLGEPGSPIEHVYFPHSGVVCLLAAVREGTVETAAIGPEGCLGFEVALGAQRASARAIVQLPGEASRVPVSFLRETLRSCPPLRERLLHFVRYLLIHSFQSAVCNGLHTVQERSAKWLLMAHDRAGRPDTFQLTQESLAEMLGVHRPSVTVVARTLQNAHLIRYSRGVIAIVDRRGLEQAACQCYGTLRRALEEILPAPG